MNTDATQIRERHVSHKKAQRAQKEARENELILAF